FGFSGHGSSPKSEVISPKSKVRSLSQRAFDFGLRTSDLGLFFRIRLLLFNLLKVEGELNFFVAEGIIFAERVALPISGHEEAPQVRMAGEINPEHVEQLALMPVGLEEEASGRRQFGR